MVDGSLVLAANEDTVIQYDVSRPDLPTQVDNDFSPCYPCLMDGSRNRVLGIKNNRLSVQTYGAEFSATEHALRTAFPRFTALAFQDELVVGFSEGRLAFIDWSDEVAPRVLADFNLGGDEAHIGFTGEMVRVQINSRLSTDTQGLFIYGVSNRDQITRRHFFGYHASAQVDDYLVGMDDERVYLYPANPFDFSRPLFTYLLPSAHRPFNELHFKDDLLLVGEGRFDVILVLRLVNNRLELEGELDINHFGILHRRDNIYLKYFHVQAWDISDLAEPRMIGEFDRNGRSITRTVAEDRYLYATGGFSSSGLSVIDLGEPTNMRVVQTLPAYAAPPAFHGVDVVVPTLCPPGLERARLAGCTEPEVQAPPAQSFKCESTQLVLSIPPILGEEVTYRWTRNGMLLENETTSTVFIQELIESSDVYTLTVTNTRGISTSVSTEVFPTVCTLALGYARRQTPETFCSTANPTVLTFIASLNNNGFCPR
ncbi:hypothetical protein [Acanthopleuribacter pedis]|uniref:Ig-like domain-containing protein n=1 Tax=Acanthopleuribacter pedis TaxID=442870 RepID=A0A8J7Q7D6_9BACT|nr:hypothetical protein [Acanthopleuribacter pedis]MBO1318154.1 hypothetical protein [Acanthopleuribacter pedis]